MEAIKEDTKSSVTLDELGQRMDVLGQQMNWLCENLQSLFGFVQAMSSNGGGVRGLMKAIKQHEPPELPVQEGEEENE